MPVLVTLGNQECADDKIYRCYYQRDMEMSDVEHATGDERWEEHQGVLAQRIEFAWALGHFDKEHALG